MGHAAVALAWRRGDSVAIDLRLRGWRLVVPEPLAVSRNASDLAASDMAPHDLLTPPCPAFADRDWLVAQRQVARQMRPDLMFASEIPLARRWLVITGITAAAERSGLLRLGFGEVLGADFTLGELAARARRLATAADAIAPVRRHGSLRLDLVAREGFAGARALGAASA